MISSNFQSLASTFHFQHLFYFGILDLEVPSAKDNYVFINNEVCNYEYICNYTYAHVYVYILIYFANL